MKKALPYVLPVLLCFGLGYFASRLQTDAIAHWYPHLDKPALTPPNWMFPVAWGAIYLLSGLSAGLVWNRAGARRKGLLALWGVQLLFNFLWSILFFTLRNPLLGLVDIILLDLLVLGYILWTWHVVRLASVLFWPYLVWIGFATCLNAYILVFN
ncbi:TspO/MBR family protein [uncultured Rikenella sp.]|uniref:TspO/MBR family protein n=1 Tax=uncultured Rikenella sp. TaxID=368003 RepID=UPI0026177065|nr:TspO/MBR family protein [uncultured Rikenella sp.]